MLTYAKIEVGEDSDKGYRHQAQLDSGTGTFSQKVMLQICNKYQKSCKLAQNVSIKMCISCMYVPVVLLCLFD